MATKILHINDLNKTYPGALMPSLKGLSLSLNAGAITGLLGPNGAGKTTTISIVCGLIKEYSGEIEVLGLNPKKHLEEIKNKIGVVPQNISLYGSLTARENLIYFGKLNKIPKTELKRKIDYFLDYFGLENSADKEIHRYSGGMKRRANIIASLLHDPELLILDEPTAGVDVQSRAMILNFLKEFHAQGKNIIYTSHLLEEAQQLCTEVAIIDDGSLVTQGNIEHLITEHKTKNLEELFLKITGRNVRD